MTELTRIFCYCPLDHVDAFGVYVRTLGYEAMISSGRGRPGVVRLRLDVQEADLDAIHLMGNPLGVKWK